MYLFWNTFMPRARLNIILMRLADEINNVTIAYGGNIANIRSRISETLQCHFFFCHSISSHLN